MAERLLTIGELARRAGMVPSALRYYEAVGLPPPPERISGQRRYPVSTVEFVGVILLLRDAGFSLAEQTALLAAGNEAPHEWRRLARRKLAELGERIAKALAAREAIEHALRCSHEHIRQCPNFRGPVAARLAEQPLQEAHTHELWRHALCGNLLTLQRARWASQRFAGNARSGLTRGARRANRA